MEKDQVSNVIPPLGKVSRGFSASVAGLALLALVACQQVVEVERPVTRVVTQVVEKPVERVVTRVVERPVERVVTRVVEKPVEIVVTRLVERPVEKVVTQVVEKPIERVVTRVVEKVVTRVVEKPVEKVVTRVVERPVEKVATPTSADGARTAEAQTSEMTPTGSATPLTTRRNLAPLGSVFAENGQDSAQKAIDDDLDSIWNSQLFPIQWIVVTLDDPYLVDTLEMVVAQTPPGQTTHEVWLGDGSGARTLYKRLITTDTEDMQTLGIAIEPPRVINEVMIRTIESPSHVAWREIRVFGQSPPQIETSAPARVAINRQWLDWPQIKITAGLSLPVQVTHAGDGSGRIFVVEQQGRIRIVKEGVILNRPFLDISDRVSCCWERGFLSVAFPPAYATKQYFYVNYTDTSGNTVVARYRVTDDADLADPYSGEILLAIEQPAPIHNGGRMAFGPNDGYLYIGTGDGGLVADAENRGQDPGTLLGKILRIDVESGVTPYTIPPTNPYAQSEGYRAEIWALGLRNPWGFTFDRQTGDLYIADVGEGAREEINYQPASSAGGENYGWSIMEGTDCFKSDSCSWEGLIHPVAEYHHSQGCAVVGGPIYRGLSYVRMQGIYFYADFCSGRIWGLKRNGDIWENVLLMDVPFLISGIGEDEIGNIYVTDYNRGSIWMITDPPAVAPDDTEGTSTPEPEDADSDQR